MKKLIILVCLMVFLLFYGINLVDETMNSSDTIVKQEPIQTKTIQTKFSINHFSVKPLYNYEITGRVLKVQGYEDGKKGTELSKYDVVLGWKEMSDLNNFNNIDISLKNRWFSWTNNTDLSDKDVNSMISNNHIIHSDSMVKKKLSELKDKDVIKMQGYLVSIIDQSDNKWAWRSSVSRNDKGDGANEIFYVRSIEVIE